MLPQTTGEIFLTDGGVETDFIFNRGIDLPDFASFVLHDDRDAELMVREYFRGYLRLGEAYDRGLVLETLTWRASSDWGERLGFDATRLRDVNRRAVDFLLGLREREAGSTVVVSGCIGPRGDGYTDLGSMDADAAEAYHRPQVEALTDAGADLVTALTLTNPTEAIGVVRAAQACHAPVVISFTVETDGVLPDGTALAEAVVAVDAATGAAPSYFMVNCAHPDHFGSVLEGGDPALARIRGVRVNASRQSHAELNESEVLDAGDPEELGAQLAGLHEHLPHLDVLGGCCGTDDRHIEAIAVACRGR
jgi:S-methylmethionine-dependent homocysteine/selenocysteine methylase